MSAACGHRTVTLVLCRRDGTVLGALPPFPAPVPFFPAVREVIEAARAGFGLDVVVLRLLDSDSPTAPVGGPVTYLAEVRDDPPIPLREYRPPLPEHPLRIGNAPGPVAPRPTWPGPRTSCAGAALHRPDGQSSTSPGICLRCGGYRRWPGRRG